MEPVIASRITDQIYLGGHIEPHQWNELAQQGITVDVNLQIENPHDNLYPGSVEAYLWLPTVDGLAPSMEQLKMGVTFIDAAVKAGKKVLIHCYGGVGRSATLCIAYFIAKGMTAKQALDFVAERRPYIGPNWEQLKRLMEFEESGFRLP